MNKEYIPFIKKISYFVLGFFVLIFLLDQLVKFSVKKINVGEFGVFNRINEGNINADIIISGSSRALKAINPEVITAETGMSCFNIASDGSDLGIQLPKFKWYLNSNKKPKILIQDISQFGGGISSTIFEPYKYLPYLTDDSLYQGILRIDEDFWPHKYFAPANLIFYNFDFYSKLGLELLQTIRDKDKYLNGFLPDNSKWSVNFERYVHKNPNGMNCRTTQKFQSYIDELIKYCRGKKIKLIFVVLPNYFRLKEIAHGLDSVHRYYQSLESHEKNTLYFDFSQSYIAKDTTFFYNFTHLNQLGASVLTKLISKKIPSLN